GGVGWNNYSVSDLVAEAEKYAAMGCRYYKMKIHHPDPRENAKRVAAVHKALGGKARMMVDVNQRLDLIGNIRQAELLEEFDLLWYEEPVLADDFDGYEEVAKKINIPVAAGENHFTRWEFKQLFDRKALAYALAYRALRCGFFQIRRAA